MRIPRNLIKPKPTLAFERGLLLVGKRRGAGVEEVGVGAIAGSVVAAAVVLPLPNGPDPDRGLGFLARTLSDVRVILDARKASSG